MYWKLIIYLSAILIVLAFLKIAVYAPAIDRTGLILAELAECESNNKELAWNANDPDTPSMGLYQFKMETWHWALKRYDFPQDYNVLNREHSTAVARAMLNDGLWFHWFRCLKDVY